MMRIIKHTELGQAFFLAIYVVFFILSKTAPVQFSRESFSFSVCLEIMFFFALLLCFLTYFRSLKRTEAANRTSYSEIASEALCNCWLFFTVLAVVYITNYVAYRFATYNGITRYLFKVFYNNAYSLHAQEFGLLLYKVLYLVLCMVVLRMLYRYLIQRSVNFQYCCLVILMMWTGLFLMNVSNVFYLLLLFDSLSIMTASVAALGAERGTSIIEKCSLSYLTLSALTSILAYAGCFLIYITFKTFNCNAIIFMTTRSEGHGVDVVNLLNSPAVIIGLTLVFLKLLFLLGAVPFQQYLIEIGGKVNYAFLYYFLVVSKIPVIFALVLTLKLVWVGNSNFYCTLLFVSGLATNIYGSFLLVRSENVKSFFVLSSLTQTGVLLTLLFFNDLIGVHLAILSYLVYAAAIAAPFLLLACTQNFFRSSRALEIVSWPDFARVASDTFSYYSLMSLSGDRFRSSYGGVWMYYFFAAIVSSVAVLVVAGFPPLAGFFLKLHLIEIFVSHKHYAPMCLILLLSLFTMYAYFGVFARHFSKPYNTSTPGGVYLPKITKPTFVDFIVFFIILVVLLVASLFVPTGSAFWCYSAEASVFFSENNYYVFNAVAEQASTWPTSEIPTDKISSGRHGLYLSFGLFYHFFYKRDATREESLKVTRDLKVKEFQNRMASISNGTYDDSFDRAAWLFKNKYINRFCSHYFVITLAGNTIRAEASSLLWMSGFFLSILQIVTVRPYLTEWSYMTWVFLFLLAYYTILVVLVKFYGRTPLEAGFNDPRAVLFSRATTIFFVIPYMLLNHKLVTYIILYIKESLWWFSWAVCYFVGADWHVILKYTTIGCENYCIFVTVFVVFCFFIPRVYSVFYFFDGILSEFDPRRGLSRNLDILIKYNRAYNEIRFEWYTYRLDGFFLALAFLVFLGPFFDSVAYVLGADGWMFAGIKVIYYCLCVITLYWTIATFIIGFILGHLFYCWLYGALRIKWLRRALRLIGGPVLSYFDQDGKIIPALTYMVIAVWAPMAFVFWPTVGGLFSAAYRLYVDHVQSALLLILPILFLFVIYYGLGWSRRKEKEFALAVYYFSATVSLYLINMCHFYNSPAIFYHSVLSEGKGSKDDRVFEFFYAEDFFSEEVRSFMPKIDGVFGYDALSLNLSTMSVVLFSMIFLITAFDEQINSKKFYVTMLFLIEMCVLITFFSLNFMHFIVGFESTLVPMAIIIHVWGSSARGAYAARQFLVYSLAASLPAIVCAVKIHAIFSTLDHVFVHEYIDMLTFKEQCFFCLSFILMFATKTPMLPVHSWLLNAHVEAPTAGSIILAAILLKLGTFGFIRYGLGFFYDASAYFSTGIVALALAGFLYSAFYSITETDIKRIVALTSIAHMNLAVIGIFSFDLRGLYGSFLMSMGHGVVSAAMFYLVGILYSRFHTRDISYYGGLATLMPLFSVFFFFFAMANAGFPWSLSFLGELLILATVSNKWSIFMFLVITVGNVLLLYANLRLFTSVCFGTVNKNYISNATSDLTHIELFFLTALVFNAFGLMWGCDVFFSNFVWDYIDMFWPKKK